MFNNIPTVLTPKEIIDKCFSKASKIELPEERNWLMQVKTQCIDKVSTVESIAVSHLKKLVKKFPSTDHLHPFYLDMLDMAFDVDAYKMSLGKVQWSYRKIVELAGKAIKNLKSKDDASKMNAVVRQFYGRFVSIIEDLSEELDLLSKCRDHMKRIPEINADIPTFLIAGMPNVGKSSLVTALSTARPRVAAFPFTTQNISIGYLMLGLQRIQIIDTPGVLDRPMLERNEMERKAISALNRIDGKIIFLFDHTGTSGYSDESQEALYNEVVKETGKFVIRVQTKLDMDAGKREGLAISTMTGDGLDRLREEMQSAIGIDA